ncbi:uncharacterized protein EV154DRAFT_571185 [Mucor mucedo]|uniref:uncharacterized protein n=1 Tax=Mucor mucedo TaxID=29922 RepID=UPI00221F22AF|nr:uncharacterized protein EV154DRAFT_571185 [Mucor mucedo]KAI7869411.1 hypothetical protein EV154DRAFT_571185 [Mucor mucedo]
MEASAVSHFPLRQLLALSRPLLGQKTPPVSLVEPWPKRNGKITSAKIYIRFKLAGVDTGLIIDIIFLANGILSALVHDLYTPVFTNIMNISKVNVTKVFDPLDPAHFDKPMFFRHQ